MLNIDERHAWRKEIERRLAAKHSDARSDGSLFFTSKPLATASKHSKNHNETLVDSEAVERSAKSAGSWFQEHRRLMGHPIEEQRIQVIFVRIYGVNQADTMCSL